MRESHQPRCRLLAPPRQRRGAGHQSAPHEQACGRSKAPSMRAVRASFASRHVSLARGGRRVLLTASDQGRTRTTSCLSSGFAGSGPSGGSVVRQRGTKRDLEAGLAPSSRRRKTNLIAMSLTPQMFRHYAAECAEFVAWAARHRHSIATHTKRPTKRCGSTCRNWPRSARRSRLAGRASSASCS